MKIPNTLFLWSRKVTFTNTDICHWTPWIDDSPLFASDGKPLVCGSKEEARNRAVKFVASLAFDEGQEVEV